MIGIEISDRESAKHALKAINRWKPDSRVVTVLYDTLEAEVTNAPEIDSETNFMRVIIIDNTLQLIYRASNTIKNKVFSLLDQTVFIAFSGPMFVLTQGKRTLVLFAPTRKKSNK